jgi:hypothetical protein
MIAGSPAKRGSLLKRGCLLSAASPAAGEGADIYPRPRSPPACGNSSEVFKSRSRDGSSRGGGVPSVGGGTPGPAKPVGEAVVHSCRVFKAESSAGRSASLPGCPGQQGLADGTCVFRGIDGIYPYRLPSGTCRYRCRSGTSVAALACRERTETLSVGNLIPAAVDLFAPVAGPVDKIATAGAEGSG